MAKKRQERPQPPKRKGPRPGSFDRILLYALAFTVFMIPLFIWPGVTEYGYGKTMVSLVAISILTILWGLTAWQRRDWHLRIPWIAFPFLAFIVAVLLSLTAAINGRLAFQSLVLSVFFFQLALLIANVVRERRDVSLLLMSIVLSASLASLYGLFQYLGVMPGAGGPGLGRIISTMGNRNYLGGFLSYLLLPSVVLVLRPRSRALRAAALGLIAFNFGTLMLVEQLAPVVGLVVAGLLVIIGLIIFRPVEPIRRNRAWLIGLLALLALTFLIEAPSGPLNSLVGLSRGEESWIGQIWERNSGRTRELDWWIGWEMFKAHPITGVGLGNYKLAFLPYKAVFLTTPRGAAYSDLRVARAAQAHGDYVQVAAELGGLGLVVVFSFLAVLAVSIWKRLRRSEDEANRLDLLLYTGGLAVFLVHALVSFPAHLPASMTAVLLFLGLIHAPVYGGTCIVDLHLGRRTGLALFGLIAAVGVVVSGFAISDLSANVLMGAGLQQLQLGDPFAAKRSFERSIALDFAPRQTYYYLATAQVQLGETEGALDSYERCFTRFVDENTYLVFADLAMDAGRLEEAREAIEFLLSTAPKQEIEFRARYVAGKIAVNLGDYSGAIRLLDELVADAPDFELPLIALGNLHQGLGDPERAREPYERALTLIDVQLSHAEGELAGRTEFTAEEIGSLRQSVTRLRNERSYVLEQLARLPEE